MACPIHDSSESNVPQFPSDASVECRQQDSEQSPQCLNRAAATDNAAEQNPNAVHCHGCEATGHDAEGDSPEACHAFDGDTSTNAADLDTPDSSSDERSEIFCPSSRNSASHFSDGSTASDDGSTTGASSGYASDAVHERFLACDGPWSTYNRRLEMPTFPRSEAITAPTNAEIFRAAERRPVALSTVLEGCPHQASGDEEAF